MANQLENSDLVIQLPWAVPQQPLVQTASVVENSNRKMELDLNHSTDTTAISSFGLSVLIAVILGLFATWLAYWYGRRSFDLTKQSFDSLIEQIKSSENVTLKTNSELMSTQQVQKEYELKFLRKQADRSDFRKKSFEYIHIAKLLMKFLVIKINNIEDSTWDYLIKQHKSTFYDEFQSRVEPDFEKLGAISLELFMILNIKSVNHYKFSKMIEDINRNILSILNTLDSKIETTKNVKSMSNQINELLILMTEIIHSDEALN